LNPSVVPPGRDDHSMVFDSLRGYVVMFGGDEGDGGTWIWDGEEWRDLGITAPARRREADMAFDKTRGVVVMYGGYDFVFDSQSIWEFNGEEWLYKLPEDGPAARSDHAIVFDENLNIVLMYGGENVEGSTWGFDGSVWIPVKNEEDSPGARWGHDMVFDSKRNRVVMFGGVNQSTIRNDIWEFDGQNWVEVTPADDQSAPSPRRDHVMVFDSNRGVTLLFGGRDNDIVGFNDMWQWDGERWTEIFADNPPSERHEMAAAFDSWRNKLVLFGGSSGETEEGRYKNDTWWFPNLPPVIEHSPTILGMAPGKSVTISANINDLEGEAFNAYVFFKNSNDADYQSVIMNVNSLNVWEGTIPAELVTEPGLQYYIGAIDNGGSNSFNYWSNENEPYVVPVSTTGSIKVFIEDKAARNAGARWRVEGTKNWRKSGGIAPNIKPGNVTIEFKPLANFHRPKKQVIKVNNGRISETTGTYKLK
jgi:hypothetical protein